MSNRRTWAPFVASLVVYVIATVAIGRDVLAHRSTAAMHDAGDPLLTAAIMHWTTTHVPLTHEWWQFPIFHPTADTLAFSEHLLGLSVIATPLEWLTGDALATYNIVALLTFPLCAAAMYAFTLRLTGSAAAAFVAGLAYGFAPYRISQSPHVQMLALFWAPLALLGLHAYVETRRRRWLVLYAAAWMLQAASNMYSLFFFSVLVALWGLWFVVARRDWGACWRIVAATIAGALPLAPILYTYAAVHARHGFARSIDEVQFFSADVAAVLCAPQLLSFWGWVRVQCRAEGELFPGTAVFVLFCIAFGLAVWRRSPGVVVRSPRAQVLASRAFLVVAGVFFVATASILLFGAWSVDLGPLHLSVSSLRKTLRVALPAVIVGLALSPRVRSAAAHNRTLAFYIVAAFITWALALGPTVMSMGEDSHIAGPFRLFMYLPGAQGLRVPARFWMITVLCLATCAGIVIAAAVANRRRWVAAMLVTIAATGVLADGWVNPMPAVPVERLPFAPALLAGRTVLRLPIDDVADISATYDAVVGGFRSINGYSGYGPSYYPALKYGMDADDGSALDAFRSLGDLEVIVSTRERRLLRLIEQQPGVQLVANLDRFTHYHLPRHGAAGAGRAAGTRVGVSAVVATCRQDAFRLALDGDPQTRWLCGPSNREQTIEIDLAKPTTVGAVVTSVGPYFDQFPPELLVETSADGVSWLPAWKGSLLAQAIRGGIDLPRSMRIVIPFAARPARYIRMRHFAPSDYYWVISELEVWSANTGVPD